MSRAVDERLNRLFDGAERAGVCLTTQDRAVRASLRRRVERGGVVRPRKGMYARTAWWEALGRRGRAMSVLRTLQGMHPDWVFCHESAALAFGLPVAYADMETVHVAVPEGTHSSEGAGVRRHSMAAVEPVSAGGLRVTPFDLTVLDCLRTEGFARALSVADAALRVGRMGKTLLARRFLGEVGRRRDVPRAVRVMLHADARSESPGESMARAAMIELGFAIPRLQVSFPRPMELGRVYRVDFLWELESGGRVIGEFDGMQKYSDPAMLAGRSGIRVLADERHRESQLSLYGMPVVRFSYRDVVDGPRLARLLTAYGIPRDEGTPDLERILAREVPGCACEFGVVSPGNLPDLRVVA